MRLAISAAKGLFLRVNQQSASGFRGTLGKVVTYGPDKVSTGGKILVRSYTFVAFFTFFTFLHVLVSRPGSVKFP